MSEQGMSRRGFLGAAAGGLGAWAVGGVTGAGARARGRFDHVVLVTMENRSFDHFLGWVPNADGRQAGLSYLDRAGVAHPTHPLAPDHQGCGHPDPDHSYDGGRVEYDSGRCDGWLRAGANDDYAIGYYGRQDLAFLGQAVPEWTTFSRYFCSILAETYPNRIYQHAAQTDRIRNTNDVCRLPTIWDRLAAAGLTGRYYYSDVPFTALWGPKHVGISQPIAAFFEACAAGQLPEVSFVDPRFLQDSSGTSGDDHPHADIRNGELFMDTIYRAVTASPNWPTTVLVFTYDEWGGFFDHVPPTPAPVMPAERAAGNRDGLRGFRVPCLLVSPFARRGHVGTRVYEHTSVLRMIESRWRLRPLTVRDATARDLASELDLFTPNARASTYDLGLGTLPAPACGTGDADTWQGLLQVARANGFPV